MVSVVAVVFDFQSAPAPAVAAVAPEPPKEGKPKEARQKDEKSKDATWGNEEFDPFEYDVLSD